MTGMLFVAAIALAQASGISVHAADVSAEAKAAVEKAITEMGCSRDVDDEVETNGDGYKAEYVLCEDGPYYLTFDKDYKLTGKERQPELKDRAGATQRNTAKDAAHGLRDGMRPSRRLTSSSYAAGQPPVVSALGY